MIDEIIERIESEISKTPTGDLRNLLTDVNITIRVLVDALKKNVGALDDINKSAKTLDELKSLVDEL